jgi:hypothetical protein
MRGSGLHPTLAYTQRVPPRAQYSPVSLICSGGRIHGYYAIRLLDCLASIIPVLA